MRDALWLSGRCEVTAGTNPSRPTLSVIEGGGGRRRTIWCDRLPGFGLRTYASGRSSYIAQAHMSGRTRVVTIGRVSVMSGAQARSLARLVLLQAYAGQSPADERQRVRAAPAFPDFMKEYWQRIEPRWKPSTANRNQYYRRCHLDGAFAGQFIDAIGAPDVHGGSLAYPTMRGRARRTGRLPSSARCSPAPRHGDTGRKDRTRVAAFVATARAGSGARSNPPRSPGLALCWTRPRPNSRWRRPPFGCCW